MRYRFALLLIVLCVSAGALSAQENTQPLPPPHDSASASVCSDVPDVDADSDEYKSGFSDGYKAGCKRALSSHHSTSGIHLDDAVADTPAPDTVLISDVNSGLLKLLGEVCQPAVADVRKKGQSQSDSERVKYRLALLTRLIEKPPPDCR
jgi:hypothetical protein